MDILGNLPPELVQMICMRLEPDDIYHIEIDFPHWMYLINCEWFWREKCKFDNFCPLEEISKSPLYKTFSENIGHWQATYFYNHAISYNLKNNIFREIPLTDVGILKEVHYFDDEMLITSTNSSTFQIFNSSTGIVKNCFSVYGTCMLCITKQNNMVVCITDEWAKIWNSENKSSRNVLYKWKNPISVVQRVCVNQNFLAVNAEYYPNRQDLIIPNLESKIQYEIVITGEGTDVLFYKNMAVHLQALSVNVMNMFDKSTKTLSCYDRHEVKNIYVKNEYVIGLCNSPLDWHISVWNIETSKLVTYTAMNANYYLKGAGDGLALLDHNKLAYTFWENVQFHLIVQVLNYITGERIFRFILSNDRLMSTCSLFREWNNKILVVNRSLTFGYKYIRLFCPNTGKLVRTVNVYLGSGIQVKDNLTFTLTKMLKFEYDGTSRPPLHTFLKILDFEN